MDNFICNSALCRHIRGNLRGFANRIEAPEGLTTAAVAITVVDIPRGADRCGMTTLPGTGDAAIILTRRASTLRNHAGQWALPGGRVEDGERPEEAALRELAEEVGLALDEDQVLGRLDDYRTRSGFIIAPLVVWGGTGVSLTPNPEEVASIHRIPLSELMRRDAPILENIPESRHPVLMMPIGDSWIAAPTAALIYQFREVALMGRDCRVGHYEQPYFAWR